MRHINLNKLFTSDIFFHWNLFFVISLVNPNSNNTRTMLQHDSGIYRHTTHSKFMQFMTQFFYFNLESNVTEKEGDSLSQNYINHC